MPIWKATPAPPQTVPARTAYITGASSGIGRALAIEYARRGADIYITARRLHLLEELRDEILAAHPERRVFVATLDVTDLEAARASVAAANDALGRLDVVIANAGAEAPGVVGDSETWDATLGVMVTNYLGAIATVDKGVEILRKQGGGTVVGFGSVATFGEPGGASYCSAKAGLEVYMQSLRTETWREPIAVTTIAPGFTDTPLNRPNPHRPWLIDTTTGARLFIDRIEQGGGHAALPKWPWPYIKFALRHVPDWALVWLFEREARKHGEHDYSKRTASER